VHREVKRVASRSTASGGALLPPEILDLVEALYAAAADARHWKPFLRRLAEESGGDLAAVLAGDPGASPGIHVWQAAPVPARPRSRAPLADDQPLLETAASMVWPPAQDGAAVGRARTASSSVVYRK
jgi:hypothetical protein